MFYVINLNNTLSLYNDNKQLIDDTLELMPQLAGQPILETDYVTASELEQHPNKMIVDDIEIPVEVPEYDEEGNPIMIPYEDTVEVIDYDEDGNPIGAHSETVIKHKQKTHTEIITVKGLIPNPNYEQEEEEKERDRLNQLSLTKREVFLALYKDKGIVPDVLREGLKNNPEALIEFDYAERYYRGNPLIDIIGASLGYSSNDMDYLFEHKEFPTEGEE